MKSTKVPAQLQRPFKNVELASESLGNDDKLEI